jgi:peptidyl-prolyl cis-trans isomerase D
MISWMQRHRKWLVITIWISTIAFIGAGVVGWGQYNYGKTAATVAKVGNVEISGQELQRSYTQLYNYFNQMFQGKFDEEQAKKLGLEKQALNQLINQALVLNLANSYNIRVSDDEILKIITSQQAFLTNGVFDKELYKTLIARNNMTTKEYEADLKKQIMIAKTLDLLALQPTPLETKSFQMAMNVADKLSYKVLDASMINVDTSDSKLKSFWETKKDQFMSDAAYEISYVIQPASNKTFTADEIESYYNANKTQFADAKGIIKPQSDVKEQIIAILNQEQTKKESLKTYVSYKKGELDKNIPVKNITVTSSNNPFDADTLKEIAALNQNKAFMKPKLINDQYIIIKLDKAIAPAQKSFEDAKPQAMALYLATAKGEELLKVAKDSVATFNGSTSDFVTSKDTKGINGLDEKETAEFLAKLFETNSKRGFVTLEDKKVVLYAILEQKLLTNAQDDVNSLVMRLRANLLSENLLKKLRKQYKIEIYGKGL